MFFFLQVQADDGLPSLICQLCRNQVEKSYNFRLLVEISDRTLRNCLDNETGAEHIAIKEEPSDQAESADEENLDIERFLMQNNLTNSEIDPNSINVILVQSEDGTQVLNICSIKDAQNSENLNCLREIKSENPEDADKSDDLIPSEFSKQNEVEDELDDLEGIRQLLGSEPQVKTVYSCSECNEIFLSENELTNHFSSEHAEDSEYLMTYNTDVSCQLCLETFQSLAELKNHIMEHFEEGRSLDGVKSSSSTSKKEELSETGGNVASNDYRYILEVSRSNENYSGASGRSDFEEDELIEISGSNSSENSLKSKNNKDSNNISDLELDMEVEEDVEYKSEILYCVREYLSEHEKSRSSGSFSCTQCEKKFNHKREYTSHLRRHLGIKPFKCTFCDKAFITNAMRKEHQREHTGDRAFACVVCGKSFMKKSELKYHEGVHTETPSTCGICKKEFSNVQSFKMHTKRHILGSRYVCETCGKSYYTNSELARHVQTHSGKREYPCPLCETSFLSRPELNRHLRYHIGKKTFRCKICFKSYFESGHLKIHERVHTGEKPYVCSVCNKAFVTKPKLVRHEKIHAKEQTAASAIADDQQNFDAYQIETIT